MFELYCPQCEKGSPVIASTELELLNPQNDPDTGEESALVAALRRFLDKHSGHVLETREV